VEQNNGNASSDKGISYPLSHFGSDASFSVVGRFFSYLKESAENKEGNLFNRDIASNSTDTVGESMSYDGSKKEQTG
jgi:hypothetical protein